MGRLGVLLVFLVCSIIQCHCSRIDWSSWKPGNPAATISGSKTKTLEQAVLDFVDPDDSTVKSHWAILVAGSNGWGNYRHQADVCHAYQLLKAGGLKDDRIIVLMYDDIANNPENPHPGTIINRPDGLDVYNGVPKDYTGANVTAKTLLAVLAGDGKAVRDKGSGRVLAAGPDDRVFLFYSDHGSAGVLGMPAGPFLYADQLLGAIKARHAARGYKELVMYIEACESGSMFEGLLGEDLDVYVTTAANAFESSWATYCPSYSAGPSEYTTCLGDLYSVAWMEDSEAADSLQETLRRQYKAVRDRTSANRTYVQGSHVMRYGTLDIDGEVIGDYLGPNHTAPAPSISSGGSASWYASMARVVGRVEGWLGGVVGSSRQQRGERYANSMLQRDADLLPLIHKAKHAKDAGQRQAAQAQLEQAVAGRQLLDRAVRKAVHKLLAHPRHAATLLASQAVQPHLVFNSMASNGVGGSGVEVRTASALAQLQDPADRLAELLASHHFDRPSNGVALVESWECLRAMVAAWEARCGPLGEYGMQHTRALANLCNAGLGAEAVEEAVAGDVCGGGELRR